MTTTKSFQQAIHDATEQGLFQLSGLLNEAWDALDDLDPMCEWGDQDLAHALRCLVEADAPLASEVSHWLTESGWATPRN